MNRSWPPRRPGDWALPLLVFILVCARFLDNTIVYKDSFHFFAPGKHLILAALREVTIYEWDPWHYLGMPFAADAQAGWFYPLNLLFLIFDFGLAHRLFILLHYPLAAAAMRRFLAGRGVTGEAAICGALVFSLSGYLISQHGPVRMLLGAAWAPLAFHFLGQALAGRPLRALAAGAVLAAQVLAGDPETALVTAAGCAVWVAADAGARRRPGFGLGALGLTAAAAFGLAAVQALPSLQFLGMSSRSGGLPLDEALAFSLHPATLIELAWPTPFGLPWPRDFYWGQFTLDVPEIRSPWSYTNYLGLSALALAAVGVWAGPGRRRAALLFGTVVAVLLALGRYTPVYALVHEAVPLFASFRYPAKFMGLATGLIAAGAGFGVMQLQALCHDRPATLRQAARVGLAAAAVLAIAAAVAWPRVFAAASPFPQASPPAIAARQHLLLGGLEAGAAVLALAAVVYLMGLGRLSARAGGMLIAAVIAGDLWAANARTMPRGPADIYESSSRAALALRRADPPALGSYRIFREEMIFRGRDHSRAADLFDRNLFWLQDTLKRNLDTRAGFEDVVGYGSYELAAGRGLLSERQSLPVLAAYNVRYIISPPDRTPFPEPGAEPVFSDAAGDFTVHRLGSALPRAYFTGLSWSAASEAEAERMFFERDLARGVIIIGGDSVAAQGPAGIAPAAIADYRPDRVTVRVDAPAAGWLVLADRDYPGWSARVDGAPAKIYRANVMVRAVRVGPGPSEAVFTFRQPWLRTGAAISLAGWTLCGLYWAGALRRRKGR